MAYIGPLRAQLRPSTGLVKAPVIPGITPKILPNGPKIVVKPPIWGSFGPKLGYFTLFLAIFYNFFQEFLFSFWENNKSFLKEIQDSKFKSRRNPSGNKFFLQKKLKSLQVFLGQSPRG